MGSSEVARCVVGVLLYSLYGGGTPGFEYSFHAGGMGMGKQRQLTCEASKGKLESSFPPSLRATSALYVSFIVGITPPHPVRNLMQHRST